MKKVSQTTRPQKKITIQPASLYRLVEDAVESGIAWGFQRADKHCDAPEKEAIKEQISSHIMIELCELLDFGDTES